MKHAKTSMEVGLKLAKAEIMETTNKGNLIDFLMCIAICTRPDIICLVNSTIPTRKLTRSRNTDALIPQD